LVVHESGALRVKTWRSGAVRQGARFFFLFGWRTDVVMDNLDLQVLRRALQWQQEGKRVVLGTVTRTWGSAPRPIGAMVAVREDGSIAGSVSGGCIEDDLADKARAGTLAAQTPGFVVYGIGSDEAHRFGLPCGGTLEIVLEPVLPQTRLAETVEALLAGKRIVRKLDRQTGAVELEAATDRTDVLELSERHLMSALGPSWRLLIIGAGQMTMYLADMAQALGYEVIVCDPREEYLEGFEVDGVRFERGMPDDTILALKPDSHMAIVALTHDPKLDDMALIEALQSEAFYVGAIGSRANQRKRKERLVEFDLSPEQIARLQGPVGLDIGARTPPEIAISILAHMTAVRYGVTDIRPASQRP